MKTSPEIKPNQYNLKAKFDYYNRMCFNGELPHLPVSFRKLKRKSGMCKCKFSVPPQYLRQPKRVQLRNAVLLDGSVSITINSAYLRTEAEFDGILIHEMIHAKFYFEGNFVESHGAEFERMRKECERKTGIAIPVTEKLDDPAFHNLQPKDFILFYRPKSSGQHGCYAFINPTHWERHGDYLRAEWSALPERLGPLHIYRVANRYFTKKAHGTKVQRPKQFSKMGFYLADEEMVDQLDNEAELLYTVSFGNPGNRS
jgi:hypothetical protein